MENFQIPQSEEVKKNGNDNQIKEKDLSESKKEENQRTENMDTKEGKEERKEVEDDEENEENEEDEEGPILDTEEQRQALLNKAQEFMKTEQYDEACEAYETLLEKFIQLYGEFDIQCAPIYFKYGNALLQRARKEDVLGNAIQRKEDLANNPTSADEKSVSEFTELLESAWNFLEVARLIYSKSDAHLNLADVLLTIGEVSMEGENMNQAIEDFEKCLAIREKLLSPSDRALAEIHFQLGSAEQWVDQPRREKALFHFSMAKKILEARLEICKAEHKDDELKELTEIIDELQDKIEEFAQPEQKVHLEELGFSTTNSLPGKEEITPQTTTAPSTQPNTEPTYFQPRVKRKVVPSNDNELDRSGSEKRSKIE